MGSGDHIPVHHDRRSTDEQVQELRDKWERGQRYLIILLLTGLLGMAADGLLTYRTLDEHDKRLIILEHEESRGSRWTAEMEAEAAARWQRDKEQIVAEVAKLSAQVQAQGATLTGISIRLDNIIDRINRDGKQR